MNNAQKDRIAPFIVVAVITLFIITFAMACTTEPGSVPSPDMEQAILRQKEGDSCLIQQKCKVTVTRAGHSTNNANIYYRCFISNDYYQLVGQNEAIRVDMNKCEEIMP